MNCFLLPFLIPLTFVNVIDHSLNSYDSAYVTEAPAYEDYDDGEIAIAVAADPEDATGEEDATAEDEAYSEETPRKLRFDVYTYKDSDADIYERADDLLHRMTVDEKIRQMTMNSLPGFVQDGGLYGACDSPFLSVEEIARQSLAAKQFAREETQLGIPPMQLAEGLHGLLAYGATIFPQAIAQGSTWNPELIEQMASAIAVEATAAGVDQLLSPVFDVIRDPRYGRTEECYGEDPFLVGTMGCSFVIGAQGDPESVSYGKLEENKVFCTAKHFGAYSVPLAGINLAPASVGERELRSTYLLPFQMAVTQAHIGAIMPAYNEIDGIPAHENDLLLNRILIDEWQFTGYVISDYGAISMLHSFHKTARDRKDAAARAFNHGFGVDLEAARPEAYPQLKALLDDDTLSTDQIDMPVHQILVTKFRANVFDKPYPDPETAASKVHTPEHVDLARTLAEESVILLKNEKAMLPLDPGKLKSIAVIGPNADQVQYGDYSYTRDNQSGVTVLRGIREYLGDSVQVHYAKGCNLTGADKSGFEAAVKAAEASDVAVVVLGESSVIFSGIGWGSGPGENEPTDPFTCGEGYDVTDINPTGVQRELIRAIHATGKPVILVLVHGRPWSITWEKENIPAILEAWYPGEQGGTAIANILFGKVNPSGKLTVSVPRSAGHIPVFYNHKPSAKGIERKPGSPEKPGRDYVFSSPEPLFPFGFGLSYTTFAYSNMHVSNDIDTGSGEDLLAIDVTVKNTGNVTGKEVVQLYIRQKSGSVTTPVKSLKAFRKIEIEPGKSEIVSFSLRMSDLSIWDKDMQFTTEEADFDIMIGSSSSDIRCSKTISTVKDDDSEHEGC